MKRYLDDISEVELNFALVMKRLYFACIVAIGIISAQAGVFPDCSYSPPSGCNPGAGDPVFVLSQDYPTADHGRRVGSSTITLPTTTACEIGPLGRIGTLVSTFVSFTMNAKRVKFI